MTVGERIKKIRQEKGLSQRELGAKLGVSQQMIGQYESGKQNPKIETIEKIANALDCRVSDIREFDGSIRIKVNPDRDRLRAEAEELIERQALGESLTDEERQKISDYRKLMLEGFARLSESLKSFADVLEKSRENILLSDYRTLNILGKDEAVKRVKELTEIPRYTEPDTPPEE